MLTYATIAIINPKAASDSVVLFLQLAVKILPVLIVVFLLMVLTNHLVSAGFVKRHLKEKSIKKLKIAILVASTSRYEKKLKKILKVPFAKKIELLIALGYPKKTKYPEKIRKDKAEIISLNKY